MSDSPFLVWISNYGQIVLFFAQILFWGAVGFAAVWATLLFRRYINSKIEVAESPVITAVEQVTPVEPASSGAAISVEEFVD